MEDPCNANPAQRGLLKTHPGTDDCDPEANYAAQLGNSKSEWDELTTVVKFVRGRCNNEKVAFVGWSAAAFVMGPYTLQNPGHVASLFLLAPIFPRTADGRRTHPRPSVRLPERRCPRNPSPSRPPSSASR